MSATSDGAIGYRALRMRRPDAFRLSPTSKRIAAEYPDASPEDCRYQAAGHLSAAADRLDRAAWVARHKARTLPADDPRVHRMYRAAALVLEWSAATRRETTEALRSRG